MRNLDPLPPPETIYPIEDWRIVEHVFSPEYVARNETIFALANGYLGMRGNFEEGRPSFQSGTFINGFYETWPIVYGEEAYGFAKTGQTMLNVADTRIIRLYIDDEPFFLPTATLLQYERALDMRNGTLDRNVLWETASGKQVSIRSRRLVSFEHRHLAAIEYEVTLLNADAPVLISSEMRVAREGQRRNGDPRRAPSLEADAVVVGDGKVDRGRMLLTAHTRNSDMRLACGVDHLFATECLYTEQAEHNGDTGRIELAVQGRAETPIRLIKLMTYHTSRSAPLAELSFRAEHTLDRALRQGFAEIAATQRRYMDAFWERSDVEIEATYPRAQQCLRFNLFHMIQATGRAEGTGVGVRGLTGQAYEGHYFWDTEVYLLPFLCYTSPRIARNLLRFRHSKLDEARQRAAEVSQRGALFPWRTINGKEASAYYAAGTAQYHINADIMYALRKYVQATGDPELLRDHGAEMLVETARLWVDLGFYSERRGGRFCIQGVTGPDEYNTVVNNNTFTNLMARENLWYAATVVESLRRDDPEGFEELRRKTHLDAGEPESWRCAADRMYVPFDERLGIHPQDDEFLDKKPWDFESTPDHSYPLLLNYHPLVIYRHKVIKQADVVMAMFLLGDEFSHEQKKRNFEYYDALTTGDSSLSACIQAIVAAEVGYSEKATRYFRRAALMDLADVGKNTQDGAHVASMGGTWMALVYGLAGLRDHRGRFSFHPRIFDDVQSLRFPLTICNQRMRIDIRGGQITYLLEQGSGLEIEHRGETVRLVENEPVSFPL